MSADQKIYMQTNVFCSNDTHIRINSPFQRLKLLICQLNRAQCHTLKLPQRRACIFLLTLTFSLFKVQCTVRYFFYQAASYFAFALQTSFVFHRLTCNTQLLIFHFYYSFSLQFLQSNLLLLVSCFTNVILVDECLRWCSFT